MHTTNTKNLALEKIPVFPKPDETPLIKHTEWNVPMCVYLLTVHLIGLIVAPLYLALCCCHSNTILLAFVFCVLSNLGITAGNHRLWTHQSYEAHWVLQLFLVFAASVANQGSIYHWVRDHLCHHMYSESIADPHDARQGLWFAHIGWLLVKKHPEVKTGAERLKDKIEQVLKNKLIYWEDKLYPLFPIFSCFFLPAFIAHGFWNDLLGGLLVAGFTKYVISLHCTWCVNSFAHFYGARPYDPEINASENWIVSILAVGEGYHNFHHSYPFDYRASNEDVCFNFTKKFLDLMWTVGLVKSLKKIDPNKRNPVTKRMERKKTAQKVKKPKNKIKSIDEFSRKD